MVKVNVYGIDGSSSEKIDLPDIFETPYRPDIIKKSYNVLHSNQRQHYGSDPFAGTKHSTASVGKGRGMSRVPRLTAGGIAALAPCVVGGRRAHPPKVEKNWKNNRDFNPAHRTRSQCRPSIPPAHGIRQVKNHQ
jgi:large subunit ribosomal protein L4e